MEESVHARVLRLIYTAAAATLVAQIVLNKRSGSTSTSHKGSSDKDLTWREDRGVSKLVPLYPDSASSAASKAERLSRSPAKRRPSATADARTETSKSTSALPRYTQAAVAKHCTREDCWVIIEERVYDVTRFVDRHPGGVGPVVNLAGKDATDVFANYHAARVYKTMLPAYLVGVCSDVQVPAHVADFRRVRQEMLRRGLFETDMRFYAKMAVWHTFLFSLSLYLSLCGGSIGVRLSGAAIMGVFWQQLAGIGHDLGHSGVTHDFHKDHVIGSALSALMGLSVGWWKSDHNTHHVVCNAVEHDPNIQHMPMLAITDKIFRRPRFWDTYHGKWVGMDAVARTLVSYQHLLFYPLMAVGRWNLYVQGLIYLISARDKIHYRKTELGGICIFFAWMIGVAYQMPTWPEKVAWVMVSHAVAGVLHVQIVLSHWAMHAYEGRAYTGADDEWYITQLRTTMNVATHPWLDWVHIGLQFQIEHHLFPRLPRHNLREARKLTKAVVAKHFPDGDPRFPMGHAYHEPGFFEGNYEMWLGLKEAALAARQTVGPDPKTGFYHSALWEGLNLAG